MSKLCSADEAANHVNSNQRVFLHGGAATPNALVDALLGEAGRLHNVELIHLHTSGRASYAKPEYERSFRVANLFVGHNMRRQLDGDRVDYLPCFLSEIPQLFRSGRRALGVAIAAWACP
jgi:acyl-CoA hydrolase